MNWDQVAGKWKQMKGVIKERWGKLTDDDLDMIAGKRDQLAGKIQERYGLTKEDAQKQIEDWERTRRQEDETGSAPAVKKTKQKNDAALLRQHVNTSVERECCYRNS